MGAPRPPWKIQENRLRATAKRQGLTLRRSPRRDPRALDYGKYWLLFNGHAVTPREGITLDQVEHELTSTTPRSAP